MSDLRCGPYQQPLPNCSECDIKAAGDPCLRCRIFGPNARRRDAFGQLGAALFYVCRAIGPHFGIHCEECAALHVAWWDWHDSAIALAERGEKGTP